MFALLESPLHATGVKVVAQRKLLYLEKLVASLLLATPRVRLQLDNRIIDLKQELSGELSEDDCKRKQRLLMLLEGLHSLLSFYLPCLFRIGFLVRCCTWDGRAKGTGENAKQVCEDVLVVLIHLLKDRQAKNEYVRTLAVALMTWQPSMSKMPGVCFAEESCEAMLSRMSHRCEVYKHLHGLNDTFNLFLTLPLPSRIPKGTRGCLKIGLVSLFASRLRKVICSDGCLPYAANVGAKTMHSSFDAMFPDFFEFPRILPKEGCAVVLEGVLRHALKTLIGKAVVSEAMKDFLASTVPRRSSADMAEYQKTQESLSLWFRKGKSPKIPKPPVKKTLMPKPRAKQAPFDTLT